MNLQFKSERCVILNTSSCLVSGLCDCVFWTHKILTFAIELKQLFRKQNILGFTTIYF